MQLLTDLPQLKHGDLTFTLYSVIDSFLNISLRFNGHFPGEPGLAGVY